MSNRNLIDDCVNIYNQYCYPVLFGELQRPPIWPVIVTAIIIFLAIGEIGSQSCENGCCKHYKNIDKSCSCNESSKNIDTIISRIKLNHTSVGWRRALILAMLLSLIILMIFYPGLPDGFDFFLISTILFLLIYFTSSWFQWHWWKARDFQIEQKLLNLRHNIKDIEIEREIENELNKNLNKNRNTNGYDSVMNHLSSILD